jgi:hypothetical protein
MALRNTVIIVLAILVLFTVVGLVFGCGHTEGEPLNGALLLRP